MNSKQQVIAHIRDVARELGALCATNGLIRLETLLWAAEQQALLETLLTAAEVGDGSDDLIDPAQAPQLRAAG